MKKIFLIFIVFTAIQLMVYCGSSKSAPTPPAAPTAEDHIIEAWQAFESIPPNYTSASVSFSEALLLESNNYEALTGRGWCYALLGVGKDDIRYTQAINNFSQATLANNSYVDAWAGHALVRYVLDDYNSAISYSNQVIQLEPDYVFSHKTDINISDIYLMRAQIYFFQGNYSQVVYILDILQPGTDHPADQPEVLLVQLQNLWDIIR